MKNSLKFSNILIILKFFYNDTFHGLFNRPFFKSKFNRYGLLIFVTFIYLSYFYLNMVELRMLSDGISSSSASQIMSASKITLSSYFNVVIILGVFLFILVNSTVKLNKSSLFFAKTLPFSEREISISQKIFKLSVTLCIFELVIIIAAPILKLIHMSIFTAMLVLLTLHTVFIASFLVIESIYSFVLERFTGSKKLLINFLLDLMFMTISTIHLLVTRFKIDFWVSLQQITILQITLMVLTISSFIGILAYIINNRYLAKDSTYVEANYFKGIPVIKVGLATTMPAILRSKNFLYFSGLIIIVSIVSIVKNDMSSTLQVLVFLFPVISFVAISYADATLSIRKLFDLYGIKPIDELLSLLGISIILMLPTLIVGIMAVKSIDPYIYGINIFFVATIAGFLFPKSQSSINETISALLTIVIVIILSALISIDGALYPALLVLLSALFIILKKEYGDSK